MPNSTGAMPPHREPRACVIGWPVRHSRSPLVHGFWLREYGLPGSYEFAEVAADQLESFIGSLQGNGFVGGNVTIPHKQAAFRLAGELTDTARALEAVNTLWFENGVLWGDNTDVEGFLANLDNGAPGWDATTDVACVLGAGGAARAIVYGLLTRGVQRVVVVNRTLDRAQALADHFGRLFGGGRVVAAGWGELGLHLPASGLVVNTTSLGMRGQPPLDIDVTTLPATAVVTDAVYVPLVTPLLAAASGCGLRTVDGLGMLLYQAVPGFERWFGRRPAVSPALRRLIAADIAGGSGAGEAKTVVLGLTGSIGMGKSTTADFFRKHGVPVYDSDAAVHRLYAGRAAPLVEAAFPGVVVDGTVDRKRLGERVLGDPAALKRLEAIVHPLVREEEQAFLDKARADAAPLVVLDIPLLFETGAEARCDAVVVVSAPPEVQRARVLARPGMTEEQFERIHVKQMPDAEKRRRADFIVDSSRGFDEAEAQVRHIIAIIANRVGASGR